MANFFNRLGHIEIISGAKAIFSSETKEVISHTKYGSDVMRSFDSLDFKFSCKKVVDMSTTSSRANVSILGLSRETIQFLATYRPPAIEQSNQKRIRIYASYTDFGDCLIFDGDIERATPSLPPNNWLDITAFVGNHRRQQLYSYAINGATRFEDLIKAVAKLFDLDPTYVNGNTKEVQEAKKMYVRGFECSGTMEDIIQSINRISNFQVYEDFGVLECRLKNDYNITSSKIVILDEKNGMIGIPEILVGSVDKEKRTKGESSTLRIKVKCFINPSISLWNDVYVKSIYLPDVNGFYRVTEIEYNGHLRGQEWYMTLTLTAAYRKGNN